MIRNYKYRKIMDAVPRSVFVLERFCRVSEPLKNNNGGLIQYSVPEFPHLLSKLIFGYFSTVENAVEVLKIDAEERKGYYRRGEYDGHFCYTITEFRLNESECWHRPESRRSYLLNGKLNDFNPTCERSNCVYDTRIDRKTGEKYSIGNFRGRAEKQIRFHCGDIVEVKDKDRVYLGVVISHFQKYQQALEEKFHLIWMRGYHSDSYIVLECDFEKTAKYHFPLCVDVFPLRLSISDEKKQALQTACDAFWERNNEFEIL